jgi:hypothetical protein
MMGSANGRKLSRYTDFSLALFADSVSLVLCLVLLECIDLGEIAVTTVAVKHG